MNPRTPTPSRELRQALANSWAICQDYDARTGAGERLSADDEAAWGRELERVQAYRARLGNTDPISQIDHDPIILGGAGPTEDVRGFQNYLRTGSDHELRAQGVGAGSSGGYAVPEGFLAKITTKLAAFGGVRALAEVLTTESGEDLPWPTNDDVANIGHILSENTQDTEQDVALGQASLGAYTYTSRIVRASMQLLNDQAVDLETWLANQLGQRIARAQAAHFITGNGSTQPQGLVTGLSTGRTTAANNAITYDELVDLVHSVDAAYREGGELSASPLAPAKGPTTPAGNGPAVPGVAWIMNDQTFAYLRKLKDDVDRPLIQPDLTAGGPPSLLGYQVRIDNAMPTMAADAKVIAFGNIRAAYIIRDVRGIEVLRMVERYADYLQVGFLGFQRTDGLVQDVSAAKLLTMHP
jgi:predicted phage gp36 major capsid-like protein